MLEHHYKWAAINTCRSWGAGVLSPLGEDAPWLTSGLSNHQRNGWNTSSEFPAENTAEKVSEESRPRIGLATSSLHWDGSSLKELRNAAVDHLCIVGDASGLRLEATRWTSHPLVTYAFVCFVTTISHITEELLWFDFWQQKFSRVERECIIKAKNLVDREAGGSFSLCLTAKWLAGWGRLAFRNYPTRQLSNMLWPSNINFVHFHPNISASNILALPAGVNHIPSSNIPLLH